ncbi:hypothetical protein ABW19_dt0208210 [Dactylella cylindrospora]|nr:hypothetical protein ABW19_dt0208210 [Dactylella cylindrospora]
MTNLLAWNPALGSNCAGLTLGTYVCVRIAPPVVSTPSPIQTGMVTNCIGWRYVQGSDTCQSIVARFDDPPINLTMEKLLRYNTAIWPSCGNLQLGYYVCVRTDDEEPTTTSTTTGIATPTPIQSGQTSDCIGWRYVQPTDNCASIVSRYDDPPISLTMANLLAWNPALGSNCAGLTAGYYVCVRK